jgi:hypothetical protein
VGDNFVGGFGAEVVPHQAEEVVGFHVTDR